jgi:hypothetical protein
MNIRRILKLSGIVLLVLILIGVLGMFVWAETGTYPARDVALSALRSSENLTIEDEPWIKFTPADPTKTGLIFYPGGLVEPAAYAPVLRTIAEEGVLVVITPMPLNLAIFHTDAASSVIESYPNISTWILAGHSLGGASAAIFAEKNPTSIDALALWDSYPPDSADLSDSTLPVVSVFGTTNGQPNTDNFNDKRHLLPRNTKFVAIEGANHAQFGDYGPQKGDVDASLSLMEQHEKVAEIMLDFIAQIR